MVFLKKNKKGFTVLEAVIALAITAILSAGVLGVFAALSNTVKAAREKTVLANLATSYLEIVRNMPYSDVGTVVGNPTGTLADFTNAISVKLESYSYKIYYEVTYIDDPADGSFPTDTAAGDYKQVKMEVLNNTTGRTTSFVTNVVPKGLEGTSNAGALLIKVFNSQGQPISGADIHIESTTTAPSIVLDRISDAGGQLVEVSLPAKVNGYHIVVTKPGYSTDQTYLSTVSNPNPIKPDATVVNGQITQVSFFIDVLANLNIKTLNEICQNISGVGVNVSGAKLIGTNPNVRKYNKNFTSSAGLIALSNIEWDTYTPVLLTGQSYIVRGTSPIQKIDVLPGTTQTYTMILGTNTTANSLLIIVKDSSTGTALEGATVHLRKGGSVPQDYYGVTGGSVWVQNDWSSGAGQSNWGGGLTSKYFQDDGNIDSNSAPTGARLKKTSGDYALSGWLESSSFDTGTGATTYTTLSWEPTSQDPATVLKFQVAANNDNATWNYVGPDGTSATFYTTPGTDIGSSLDNNRYIRYKAFLSTTDNKKTPVLTSLSLNFVTGCFTPGQVIFPDLTAGNNYDLDVQLTGYQTVILPNLNINGNQSLEVLMSP